jgi:hypothetical protein
MADISRHNDRRRTMYYAVKLSVFSRLDWVLLNPQPLPPRYIFYVR